MRLLFAVSDHGFGHATRTVALLRAAFEQEPALEVRFVSGPKAARLLSASFAGDRRVTVRTRPSDPGLLLKPSSLKVDSAGTASAWRRWIAGWEEWARGEADEARGVDAVVTDGTPPALLAARRLGVPGLLLGNFAWSDVLAWHLPEDLLGRVREALGQATASFAYPFALPFDGAPAPEPLPLVARRPGRSRASIRASLGVDPAEPLVYMSAGQSSDPGILWRLAEACGARALLPRHAPGIDGAVRIPDGETEGHDYLAASDLVVGKVGYGTLAEALVAGVPSVMVLVDRTPETGPLKEGMERAGAGEAVNEQDDLLPAVGRWLGRGGGRERPYRLEDSAGAARRLLEAARGLSASSSR